MNRIKIACFFVICLLSVNACEKDDICVDGDTPLLIIRFYDIDDETELKEVEKLRIVGVGQETTVDTFTDRTTTDSIAIPLRPDIASTSYYFISDSEDNDDGNETGNTNTLKIDYSTKEVYVSRACGFIANYENLETSVTTDSELWIDKIEIVNQSIENSNAAHVKIYH